MALRALASPAVVVANPSFIVSRAPASLALAQALVAVNAPVFVEISILSPGFNDNNSLVASCTSPLDMTAFVLKYNMVLSR